MVTAAKAAFDLHIPNEPLLVGEYEVQQSTSPRWLLSLRGGSYNQCTPGTSWLAYVLLCCYHYYFEDITI